VPVRIVTDSACDLPQALADELGIVIVPLSIRFGAEEFVDRQDLSVEEFWRRSKASAVLPSTAAPSPGAFEVAYRTLKDEGATGVVVVSLSGELSATIQSAQLAARAVADDISVTVVDSRSVTIGQGMIAVAAARHAAQGATESEVAALVTSLAERTQVWGALDTLENLKKGGRIGNAKALLASVLSIKPIIEIRHGKVEEGGKQRTRSKAMAFLVEKVRSEIASRGSIENLAVVHAATTDVDALVSQLQAIYPHPIVIGDIGPVIGSHTGTGTIAVVFQVPAS
jgi:DegV family protein with EDD domain